MWYANQVIEEVYFGKAKDVVGELRSKSYHSLHDIANTNEYPRSCSSVRDEQGQGCSIGDDQVPAEVVCSLTRIRAELLFSRLLSKRHLSRYVACVQWFLVIQVVLFLVHKLDFIVAILPCPHNFSRTDAFLFGLNRRVS